MLTLIIGTDWKENTDIILNRIASDVRDEKCGRILMVPELISHDTERRLCAAAGDTCSRYAEVLSFTRLAKRVSDSIGHAAQVCMDNGGRVVAMASAASQLHSKLKAYASVETRPEFIEGLVDAVDEFKRCCITPQDLLKAAEMSQSSFAQKLEELALLYECYNSLCQQGKKDPRDQMTWLLEELEKGTFSQEHVFYIDGFPDFTRQHMQILFHLIETSSGVTVSLTCDAIASHLTGFEKAGDTASQLYRFARSKGIEVNVVQVEPRNDALSVMRKQLLQGHLSLADGVNSVIRTYKTDTVYQECQLALEEVLRNVYNGARYRDMSIVCTDMDTYRDSLEMLFSRCDIPLYLSGTEDILQKPVLSTVLAAMDAALGGFDGQDMLWYLKSALSPIEIEVCDDIENYVLLWAITGSRWLNEWTHHPDGLGKTFEPEDRRLQQLNAVREMVVNPLVTLRDAFRNARKVKDQVTALYSFLQQIRLDERLSLLADELEVQGDNRNAQILNQLWDILLTALEQLYDVLGETAWDAENFTRLFKLLLKQYDVGTIPPVLDSVMVGPINAMRCQRCKHLIVLGAQEGTLPGYGGSSGVLTDRERTTLREMGVPLTGGALEGLHAEFADIYGVFCGAQETVCVTHSGDQPSVVYRRLSGMSGGERKVSDFLGAAMGSEMGAVAYLVRNRNFPLAEELMLSAEYKRLSTQTEHAPGEISCENVRKLYGNRLRLSASQIDAMAQCRFYYFMRYGIHANERKPATIDPAEFGTYVHAVLENTVHRVMELGGFNQVSMEDTLKIAGEYSRTYAQERFSDIDAKRLNYLFDRNSRELSMIVQELWKELHNSDFRPVGFEVGFGEGKDVGAIDVSGERMPAYLRGFVDRVDIYDNDANTYYRVVDYKTGKKDFDYCDLYNGYGLQMLLYLFALDEGGYQKLGDSPLAAGVQYFPARVPIVSADGKLSAEEAEALREKLWKRKGLLLEDEIALEAMQREDVLNRLPYTRKKDGTLSGDLADSEQFRLLKKYVYDLVGKMVDEIASGKVDPNPYTRGTSHDACAFCPYSAVCHKQDVKGRRNYKAISNKKFWDDVAVEVNKNGG